MMDKEQKFYGRRKGRLLRTQKSQLMANLLPALEIKLQAKEACHPAAYFAEKTRTFKDYALEIGFGGGEHLAALAQLNPETGFIGCEAFVNGVASLLEHIDHKQLDNIRIYPHPVQDLLKILCHKAFSRAFILFPDPWPKARHQKRRLVNPDLLQQIASLLTDEGLLHLASDDADYIQFILESINRTAQFRLDEHNTSRPGHWPPTRYEQKALTLDKTCHYLTLQVLP